MKTTELCLLASLLTVPLRSIAEPASPGAKDLPSEPVSTPDKPSEPVSALPAPLHPNAGFGNEVFFLRDDDDNFILIPAGRFQYDFYAYQGGSNEPYNAFLPKRARLELYGTFLKHWDYQLGTELTGAAPTMTDVYVNANYTHYANVQLGQFDAPFTMENRTSDKWTDLQERNVAVRGFAIPENKEIGGMVWGQPESKWAYWSLGMFNGEGLSQLTHRSNNFDVMGRAWIAPLALADADSPLKSAWIGASFWTANRSSSISSQLDHLTLKDSAGYAFFNPVYGNVHAGDCGRLLKWGLELNAPVGPFVLKAEYIHSSEGVREIDAVAKAAVRNATLSGDSYYVRLSYFVFGDPLINGLGGTQNPPRLFGALKAGKTETALQLIAEYDHVGFDYTPEDGADPSVDKLAGSYAVDVVGLGANYWLTKHVRLTGNFLFNSFSGAVVMPLAASPHSVELTFRVALAI